MASSFASWAKRYAALLFLAAMLALLLLYYWHLHRNPFTQNAFLVADTRPVSPLVEGYLTQLFVRNHQRVKKGDPLFSVYKVPYELRVRELESALEEQKARSGTLAAKMLAAQAAVRRTGAELRNREFLAKQALRLYQDQAAVSLTYLEEALRAAEQAQAAHEESWHAAAVVAGEQAENAAAIRRLEQQLKLARVYLEQTTVYALADGYVNNLMLSPGGYYRPGDVLFALVETTQWYVQGNFEETDLACIAPGQAAKIWLWQYPGKTFHGRVENPALGAERRYTAQASGVQKVEKENQWFMLPQRLPVQIRILDPDPEYPFNLGGSAFVQIETSSRLLPQLVWRVLRWE